MKILLGSNSPRRRELLAGLDVKFEVVKLDADESYPASLRGGEIAQYIAERKADAYVHRLPEPAILITADTIVWCEGEMLGKPQDEADARRMLRLLSGKTHQVYTGVAMRKYDALTPGTLGLGTSEPEALSFVVCTDVTFREITDGEIDYYITHYRPFDKAGAYGIQEWIGYVACTRLEGSYFNVMGFPVQRVNEALSKIMCKK